MVNMKVLMENLWKILKLNFKKLELVYKMPKLHARISIARSGTEVAKNLPDKFILFWIARKFTSKLSQYHTRRLARSLASLLASLQPKALLGPLPFPPLSLPLSVSCSLELTLRVPHPLRCLPPLEGVPWVKSRLASWQSCRRRWIQHFPAERLTADSVHREVWKKAGKCYFMVLCYSVVEWLTRTNSTAMEWTIKSIAFHSNMSPYLLN